MNVWCEVSEFQLIEQPITGILCVATNARNKLNFSKKMYIQQTKEVESKASHPPLLPPTTTISLIPRGRIVSQMFHGWSANKTEKILSN
jgi:hypothetical protein